MKRFFVLIAIACSLTAAVNAQVKGQALGLRLGGYDNQGVEVTYQHPLGNANRLEFNLGANNNGFMASGIYQWVWDLSSLAEGFNWYAGVGAGLASKEGKTNDSSKLGIGAVGQIGMEYNFNIPIQLSLDYRPGLFLIPNTFQTYDGICLSVRYRF